MSIIQSNPVASLKNQSNPHRFEWNYSRLKEAHVMIGVPMYGGQCYGSTALSLIQFVQELIHYRVPYTIQFLYNESLIPRARNYIAAKFLDIKDATHLFFIDSDIEFKPRDALNLLAISTCHADKPYDILGAAYPKKNLAWTKVYSAVNKGLADENPEVLENYTGDFVINALADKNTLSLTEPQEVLELGTGFMLIRRDVFERFMKAYPEQKYRSDNLTDPFSIDPNEPHLGREMYAFFDTPIDHKNWHLREEIIAWQKKNPNASAEQLAEFILDPEKTLGNYSRRYLSEDYMFCQAVRRMGGRVWLFPAIELNHQGYYNFKGGLLKLAEAGLPAGYLPHDSKQK